MGIKGKLLALVMALVLMLAVAASAGAVVKYDYRLPDGYDANMDIKYPVVYILPQDGYAKDTSAIYEKFKSVMANGTGMDMILVKPQFEKGMDLNAELDALVAVIDSKYNTIADPAYRTLIGTGTGGYLAYVLGLKSETFGNLASINGNFVDNAWYATYGDVYKLIENAGAENLAKYYTYMDAPVDGTWTNMENSSNDIGQMLISFGLLPTESEYTVRPGIYDDAFVTESVNRVADRLTQNMLGSIFTGTVSLDKGVLTSDDKTINANYSISVNSNLANLVSSTKANVTVSVVDENDKVIVSKTDSNNTITSGTSLSNDDVAMSNKATKSSTVVLSVSVLGVEFELATANLIISQDPTADIVDLMGDWYFSFTGASNPPSYLQFLYNPTAKKDMAALSSTDTSYRSWSVVQPGLGWWTYGFGNLDLSNPALWYIPMMGMDNFDSVLVGNGYYVKEFYLPANFKIEGSVLSMGYVDDRCEVYVNGKRVGGTGIDEKGNSTGESSWEKYTSIPVTDTSMFNLGGMNTIVVRDINDGFGGGGWYAGPIGFYSAEAFAEINPEAYDPHFYEETFTSKYAASALGKNGTIENKYLIYLPEDYYETDRYYPTLYLMHQYQSTHKSYKTDHVDQLLNEGVEKGLFDEMIVVVPNSQEESWWAGDWLKMVSEELVPHIDANYRTIPDARYRFTAGCSMGGQGAFGVALQNPDLFSGAVSFFGAFSMGESASPNTIADKESAEYMDYFDMYFICGNQDLYDFGIPAIELNQQLDAMGVNHYFFIENGAHDSAFYVPHFQPAMKYMRDNMYKNTSGSAASLINVDYAASYEELVATFGADEAIRKYFNVIPKSKYTKNTNPGLTIPVIATITYEGGTADVKFFVTFDDNNLIVTENVILKGIVPEGAAVHNVKFHTQLLGRDNKADSEKVEELKVTGSVDLPSTGDNSNIFLFAALLMMSVVGMTVMSKKKASC